MNYAELQEEYYELKNDYNELQAKYDELLWECEKLQEMNDNVLEELEYFNTQVRGY